MLEISIDLSEFQRRATETVRIMGEGTRRAVFEAAIAGADYARQHHPHKSHTGRLTGPELYAKLRSADARGAEAEIRNDVPYARYVEEGTVPHEIWPKEGHGTTVPLRPNQSRREITDIGTHRVALRFMIGGRTVFARMVHHPGNAPMPFMEPAGVYAQERIVFETEHVTFVAAAALWG